MMRRKMAYCIVEADNVNELVQRVTTLMGQGFMPNGSPFAAGTVGLVGPAGAKFYQGMMLIQDVEEADVPALGGGGPKGLVPSA